MNLRRQVIATQRPDAPGLLFYYSEYVFLAVDAQRYRTATVTEYSVRVPDHEAFVFRIVDVFDRTGRRENQAAVCRYIQ